MKKIYSLFLIAAVLAACIGCRARSHEHSFGEWETKMTASCDSAAVEVRKCKCGEEETREGDPATGHTFTSITAVSKLEKPMAGLTVAVSDLSVTATCIQGESVAVTDGIIIENATLALGKNTVTVKFGDLSTTLDIEAAKLDVALEGSVTDDAHISSGDKDRENSSKKEMGTKVDEFRAYLRINVREIINTDLFVSNKDDAKVQLILPITSGGVTDTTTFKLRTFMPAEDVTNADFSRLTWNSVDKTSTYGALNWSNGTVLLDAGVGHNVSAQNDQITITLAYSQIADFVDENGNIVFAFATNTDGLKIGSLENKTEENRPAFKIVLNDEHFHIFDQEVVQSKYLVSAGCKEKEKYRVSCTCGEAGSETFVYGGIIDHAYGEAIPGKLNTCTTAGMKEHYQCSRCGKYFLCRDGQMKLVKEEDVKLSAGHDYKLIPQKEPTCTEGGNHKYYKCGLCGKYFDTQKNETTKEAQKIDKLEHTYGDLIPEQARTCTEDGMKTHYECEACGKTFLEKDGEKVLVKAENLVISAGHDTKVIGANEPTCTKDGNNKYYQCKACGKYFTDKEGTTETSKEAQKIQKVDHTYGDLIPEQVRTCTEDGVKAHYKCEACGKTFLEKDGEKVLVKAEDLKISAGHDTKVIGAKEPTCTKDGNNKYYQCKACGKYFTDKEGTIETTKDAQKIQALGHSYTSILAVSNLDNPMETMVVKASDLSVTGTCGTCGESVAIAEGIELEGATLALGENTVTVKYGVLSTTVTIEATELYVVLDGTVTDDTYVYSSGKSNEYTDKEELGTYSSSYRAYFRVNVSNILENELFLANRENAKLQLVLAVTSGSVLDSTSFTLKAYAPAVGTDAPFSALTWNSVDNKEGSIGAYSQLHWSNGVVLSTDVRAENSKVMIEIGCNQILDYIDQDGNILFAFTTNTSGLKVGSIENTSKKPSVKVVIDGNISPVRHNALKIMGLPYQQSKHRCFDILEVL